MSLDPLRGAFAAHYRGDKKEVQRLINIAKGNPEHFVVYGTFQDYLEALRKQIRREPRWWKRLYLRVRYFCWG